MAGRRHGHGAKCAVQAGIGAARPARGPGTQPRRRASGQEGTPPHGLGLAAGVNAVTAALGVRCR